MYPTEYIEGVKVYKVPVSKVYQALKEENGHVELIRGEWFSYGDSPRGDSGVVIGACILGQGSINMGVVSGAANNLGQGISFQKEGANLTLVDQLNRFSVPELSKWHAGSGVGSTIIYWNDLQSNCRGGHGPDGTWTHDQVTWDEIWDNDTGEVIEPYPFDEEAKCTYGYELDTYEEVLKMAYDLLLPHFSETVYLAAYEYNF